MNALGNQPHLRTFTPNVSIQRIHRILPLSLQLGPQGSHRINSKMFTHCMQRFERAHLRRHVRPHHFNVRRIRNRQRQLQHLLFRRLRLTRMQNSVPRLPRRPFLSFLPLSATHQQRGAPHLINRMVRSHSKLRRTRQFTRTLEHVISCHQGSPVNTSPLRHHVFLFTLTSVSQRRTMVRTRLFSRSTSFRTVAHKPMMGISRTWTLVSNTVYRTLWLEVHPSSSAPWQPLESSDNEP